ncbi:MAG: isomerase [Crocinitomicaceae bacterium]|jgi:PhzF family phenazine biosynthesis protein|nr:isomerase [Crocinitomicaceae bacterium]
MKIYQVDAFTDKLFGGNPAAVCPLDHWPADSLLQQIAMENNLAETAFYIKQGDQYEIRWFTPAVEVDLCGHATLAAAYVLFHHEGHSGNEIHFHSHRSGKLSVTKQDDLLSLNFPVDEFREVPLFDWLTEGFDPKPLEAFQGKTDYMLVFEKEQQIRDLKVDFGIISGLDGRGVIVTAPGKDVDFVSRFFAPQSGIPEDPVTGSAHTTLTPYWSQKTGKQNLTARQLSARGGYLKCKNLGDRIEISGTAKLYLKGEIFTA